MDEDSFEEVSKILKGAKRTANKARQADEENLED